MAGETKALAEYAALLRYEDIPAPVIAMTKACVIDAVAVALFGSSLPWSNSVEQFARHVGSNGSSTILAPQLRRASAPAAALANGTFAHAFEFDNLRQPSVGVHPGSTATVGALAVAEECGASGRDFLTALVAGNECMLRTGLAAKQTSELMGFHAPGQTGVFGSAIAASRIMKHNAHQTTMAIGIGGSLCSGLLAFAKAGNGGMVKRLHMGRAAEGGVTAAYLAARGFEGPDVLLEGKFGYLDVYARDGDPQLLTDGLGSRWESLNIWFKMFPCHVTAQAPVRAIRQLQRDHGFGIGVGLETMAERDELILQRLEILDDAVMHDGDAVARDRVRVPLRRFAVRRPTRMSDTDPPMHRGLRQALDQPIRQRHHDGKAAPRNDFMLVEKIQPQARFGQCAEDVGQRMVPFVQTRMPQSRRVVVVRHRHIGHDRTLPRGAHGRYPPVVPASHPAELAQRWPAAL